VTLATHPPDGTAAAQTYNQMIELFTDDDGGPLFDPTATGGDGPTPSLAVDHETLPDHECLDVRNDDGYLVNIDVRDGDKTVRVFDPNDDCTIAGFDL
jgi:hypothetical protein